MTQQFKDRLAALEQAYTQLIHINNEVDGLGNGIFDRYKHPVITAQHAPITWKYDLDPATNPYLMERYSINAAFNAGAIKFNNKYVMVVRVEGADRKSFFAVAESPNGIDHFEFWEQPVTMPETDEPDTNLYDMRLTAHQDGWIYGLFCTERRDPEAPAHDQSMAIAACGIARTKDLLTWERLADLKTNSPQQRNVVLHPEFVNGKYALYTRPQDGFISAGKGGGIGFGLTDSMDNAVVDQETIIDNKQYHTVYEAKNGQGPAPVKTEKGWLHLAHGVRNTAAGLRYTLYMFMTDLNDLTKVTHKPGGYFLAPEGAERIGDVSNVAFCNGWIKDEDGKVFIYYASSDTRMHVATTTIDKLVDYVMNTPADGLRSAASVNVINSIVNKNKSLLAIQS
ncbi:glycoside hydrolase family 130 protein [Mucilaginibacter phyllosphaerae]|uniref:4-O-beta-D-mannosyl-D-glucose phosphorylase n=1 Tax=Mucilaginibacter phyllosphaerae TaxID=1812349 RepID=A0A4Y8AH44_9SPHI|nr:glycosidase [Mucilaginibacter phyllosphaerae]MBB3968823.1 4-O-beta-D-mannosyl-D-glucose phosphorylase [Mucilaginibacter phyllosphaerae]TEW67545.1 glycosidase [Mucilaginibacter phyllosphaerae]GGH13675.1 4-O-beta-D-mannosyl-D-glucose phosphorylase [Mucilaginibacter phyllosphaerae]